MGNDDYLKYWRIVGNIILKVYKKEFLIFIEDELDEWYIIIYRIWEIYLMSWKSCTEIIFHDLILWYFYGWYLSKIDSSFKFWPESLKEFHSEKFSPSLYISFSCFNYCISQSRYFNLDFNTNFFVLIFNFNANIRMKLRNYIKLYKFNRI